MGYDLNHIEYQCAESHGFRIWCPKHTVLGAVQTDHVAMDLGRVRGQPMAGWFTVHNHGISHGIDDFPERMQGLTMIISY